MIHSRKTLTNYGLAIIVTVTLVACNQQPVKQTEEQATPAVVAKAANASPGIILENMDTSIKPQDDFYHHVNGTWLRENNIPDDRTIWGGFSVLRKATDANVLALIGEAKQSGKYAADTDQGKAIAIFESELDTETRNGLGIQPLLPTLAQISAVKTSNELQTLMAKNIMVNTPLLGLGVFGDLNDSSINAAYIFPGSLGLPERNYYFDQDEKSVEIRAKYVNHIVRMFGFLGEDEQSTRVHAEKILALETQLAEPQLTKEEQRDARNFNNPRTIAEIQAMLPAVNIDQFLNDLEIPNKPEKMIVGELKFTEALQDFLSSTPIEDIKLLARWATLNSAAGMLGTDIERANWEFYAQYLRGAKEQRPANERALATVNNSVGEALGQLYVDASFPPEAKAKAKLMIENVIAAFQNRIKKLDWMSETTKLKAVEKLEKFSVKIGYPDEWEDYSKLKVAPQQSYFDNMVAVQKWAQDKSFSEIGEPVDRGEWGMSPQEVNAYFSPLNNEIVFPAAILQPPFYNYLADEAVNYGGIGAVIGHEISHAFDDSGSRFDGDGNLVNWWSEEDLAKFTERGKALDQQYSQIEVLDGLFINGEFTLGENIGDLGGVLGAYDGLQRFIKDNGRPDPIDGFTAEQRFFMSWATVWRTLVRDDELRTRIKTDPHAPGRYRATQPLLNVDAFFEAFDIKEGDGMWLAPEQRVRIW